MPAFILFEPSPDPLKRRPDLRYRSPTATLPATRAHRRVAVGSEKDHSVQMLRKHYWEVVDRETEARYWATRG